MTILVAYAPRPEGNAALQKGIELAKQQQVKLLVVNASPGGHDEDAAMADASDIERIENLLESSGVDGEVKQFVRGNDAVTEIEALISSRNIDLVIIGLRKRTAVGKLLLGSVAHDILMSVPCPVLAVKAS